MECFLWITYNFFFFPCCHIAKCSFNWRQCLLLPLFAGIVKVKRIYLDNENSAKLLHSHRKTSWYWGIPSEGLVYCCFLPAPPLSLKKEKKNLFKGLLWFSGFSFSKMPNIVMRLRWTWLLAISMSCSGGALSAQQLTSLSAFYVGSYKGK